jgi:uncharacterized RmlC-like cupin family protein
MSAPNPGQKWNIPDVMKQLGTLETLIGDHEAKPGVPATSTMSLHLYRLAAKQSDNQTPHSQEELYYILLGSRTLSLYYGTANEKRVQADVGDIIYVPANVPHRFEGSDELITLVFFAPSFTG